jgi:osmoprotectant transport system permease protein
MTSSQTPMPGQPAPDAGFGRHSLPLAAFVWLALTAALVLIATQTITLRDQQRFPNDFALSITGGGDGAPLVLEVTAGTTSYTPDNTRPVAVEPGQFTADAASPLAAALFAGVRNLVAIDVAPQTITMTFNETVEPANMLQRASRALAASTVNNPDGIRGEVTNDPPQSLRFTTDDPTFEYAQYVANLIPEGSEEPLITRAEAEEASALAQHLFSEVRALETLVIAPETLTITYRDGAVQDQVIARLTEALNSFYPRARLGPTLWLLTVGLDGTTVITIDPVNTGLPLYVYTLVVALAEAILFFTMRNRDDKLVRPLIRVTTVFLFFWSMFGFEPLWDFVLGQLFPTSPQLLHPSASVINFAAQHLELVIVSSLITVPLGLFIGILVTRDSYREVLPLVNNLVNSGQTVPTLAVVAIMAPIIGFGFWPAIIALIIYGLLPVVRNTIAGLEAVDDFVIDSARGMGLTPSQILFRVELPIASSVIMAGIRTSLVINIGTATLGAFVGSGGLGTPIASGLAMTVDAFILLGAIPAALLAILVDYIMGRIEFVITPRGLQIA